MICFKTLHYISTSQPLHFTGPFKVKLDHDSSSHLTVNHKSSHMVTIGPAGCPSKSNRIEIAIFRWKLNRNRSSGENLISSQHYLAALLTECLL